MSNVAEIFITDVVLYPLHSIQHWILLQYYNSLLYAQIGFVFKILDHKMKYMYLSVYRHLSDVINFFHYTDK